MLKLCSIRVFKICHVGLCIMCNTITINLNLIGAYFTIECFSVATHNINIEVISNA